MSDLVNVEEWPSLDGVWKRTETYANGDRAVFDMLNTDGTERLVTSSEMRQHYGDMVAPHTWWTRLRRWLEDKFVGEEVAPF